MELPLAIAIGAIVKDNKILMIRRIKEPYKDLWGFPGGKIEKHEHPSEAAIREAYEETGLKTKFVKLKGLVSERLIENDQVAHSFILHICELVPLTDKAETKDEGLVEWVNPHNLNEKEIIPTDIRIIKEIILSDKLKYTEADLIKTGNEHILKRFEHY